MPSLVGTRLWGKQSNLVYMCMVYDGGYIKCWLALQSQEHRETQLYHS